MDTLVTMVTMVNCLCCHVYNNCEITGAIRKAQRLHIGYCIKIVKHTMRTFPNLFLSFVMIHLFSTFINPHVPTCNLWLYVLSYIHVIKPLTESFVQPKFSLRL